MKSRRMEVVAPDRKKHGDEMMDLIAKVFPVGGYYEFMDYVRRGYVLHSHYDWQSSRIGMMDGKIVTHSGVWDYGMRVGSATLRVGGIGVVATHGDYRKRGLMAETQWAVLDAMRENGYDMTVLFGIRDFYQKFGYVRAWADSDLFVDVKALPPGRPTVRARKFASWARPDVAAMYNRENAQATGTAVRPSYLRDPRRGDQWQRYLWTDKRGRLAGYVICTTRFGKFECIDMGGDAEEGLRVLGMLAKRLGYTEVKFFAAHHDSAVAKWLRRNTSRRETRFVRSGGPMVRTINLRSSLEKLRGEFSKRLAGSAYSTWSGKLLVADAREKVTLNIRKGKVSVRDAEPTRHAIRGGDEVAQLIIGTDGAEETIGAAGTRCSGEGRGLARVLFPNLHPSLCALDRF